MLSQKLHIPTISVMPRPWRLATFFTLLLIITQVVTPTQLDWLIPLSVPATQETVRQMSFQPVLQANRLSDFAPVWANHIKLQETATAVGIASLPPHRNTFITADDNLGILVEQGTFPQAMRLEFSTQQKAATDTFTQVEKDVSTELLHQFAVEIINPTSGTVQHEFDHPVRVTIDLREYGIDLEETGGAFFIAYRNPANPRELIDVPITVHDKTGLISAEVTHFSDWASGWRPEGWVLHWDLPTAQGFNGAATYGYPIEVPPGRNGLQPQINLSYSSSAINGAIQTVNGGSVAAGWSLNEIAVVRTGIRIHESGWTARRAEEYRLVLNGAGHELVREANNQMVNGGAVYILEDNPQVRAIRFGSDEHEYSVIYWVIQTGDGLAYRLGHDPNARTQYYLICHCGGNSDPEKANFDIEWHVDTVTDPYGNMMVYKRDNTKTTHGTTGEPRTVTKGSRVTNIYYNFPQTAGSYPVAGPFNGMAQLDTDNAGAEVRFFYDDAQLTSIRTIHDRQDSADATHRYDIHTSTLTYENECTKGHGLLGTSTKVVWGISEMSRLNGSDAWQSLPTQRFEYEAMSNFTKPFQNLWQPFHGIHQGERRNGNCFNYYRLSRVENGYGGAVEFDYQSDGREAHASIGEYINSTSAILEYPKIGNSWFVSRMRVSDGVGHVTRTNYDRRFPCYVQTDEENKSTLCPNNEDGNDRPEWGTLAGFEWVTTNVMNFSNDQILQQTVTQYNQGNIGFGKPAQVDYNSLGANGTLQLYQRVQTEYHNLTVNGARLRPVSETTTTQYAMGGSANMTQRQTYTYDTSSTGYGHVTEVRSYLNGALHQTAQTDYLPPETNNNLFWINRIEQQRAYDKGTTLLSETSYGYSGQGHEWVTPVRVTTGLAGTTTTSSMEYDVGNGNILATIAPNGNRTELSYDTQYSLYPVRATGSGNDSCTFFDIYGFPGTTCSGSLSVENNGGPPGLLYQVTDPNGVKSKYEYDVHGRLIATYAPNDLNTPAATTTYHDFTSPFQIQTDTRGNLLSSAVQYYDGLGRPIMTEQLGVMVNDVEQDLLTLTGYDELGQVVRKTTPIQTPATMGDQFYSYQPASGTFKLAGFRDSFAGSTLNTNQWLVSRGDTGIGQNFVTLQQQSGNASLTRTESPLYSSGDQVWGFDFAATNPGDARFAVGIQRGSYAESSGAQIYRTIMVETNAGTDAFDTIAFELGRGTINRQDLFPWKEDKASDGGNDLSKWYSVEIRRSGSTFTVKITQKDDPSVTMTNTINAPAEFGTNDWKATFHAQPATPPTNRLAELHVDNYYEYTTGSDTNINPDGVSTVYGYTDPNDNLIQPSDMKMIQPDGSEMVTQSTITAAFNLDGHNRHTQQTVTDALGNIRTHLTNPEGQLALVREHNSGGSVYADTAYEYDLFGNLDRVIDANGNVSQMGYDPLGRKTSMSDPDMGEWAYVYDVVGNLTEQFDANGNRLCFYYDALNRMTYKTKTSAVSCPSSPVTSGDDWLASYEYDTAANGVGLLAKVSWAPDGATNYETFAYDDKERAVSHTRVIDGKEYTMTTLEFDVLNRPTKIEYPDGEVIETVYDREGENSLMVDNQQLVNDVQYNERGQMTLLDRTAVGDTTYSYYGATGSGGNSNFRLQEISHDGWGTAGNTPDDYRYTYDLVGNIRTLQEASQGTVTFDYDHLYRLTSARGLYSRDYIYNKIGNMMSLDGTAYQYDGSGHDHSQPHAVTAVGADLFTYDKNGNMITRDDGTLDYIQQFDEENRLVEVTQTDTAVVDDEGQVTTFAYDSSGQRTITVQPDGTTTHYPFPNYEVEYGYADPFAEPVAGRNVDIPVGNPELTSPSLSFIISDEVDRTHRVDRLAVDRDQLFRLTWGWEHLSACEASNGWYGTLARAGTVLLQADTLGETTFTISCEMGNGESMDASVTVVVSEPLVTTTPTATATATTMATVTPTATNTPWPTYTPTATATATPTATPTSTPEPRDTEANGLYLPLVISAGATAGAGGARLPEVEDWPSLDEATSGPKRGVEADGVQGIGAPFPVSGLTIGEVTDGFPFNPDLEIAEVAGSRALGWLETATDSTDVAHVDGAYRLGNETAVASDAVRGTVVSNPFWVERTETYDISFAVRGALQDGDLLSRMRFYDRNGGEVGLVETPFEVTSDSWQTFNQTIVIPRIAVSARLELVWAGGAGWVEFDEVRFSLDGGANLVLNGDFTDESSWQVLADEQTWFESDGSAWLSNLAWAEVGSRPFEITPNEQYQLSATVAGQINGAVGLSDDYGIWVEYFDPSGVVLAHTKVLSEELPIEATELTAVIEAPATAVMMRLIIASHGLNGWVTYDNLFVERMPEEQVKVRKTYLFAGQPIAQRTEITSNAGLLQDELHYIFTDHLGSASTVTDDAGEVVDVSRFFPFGEYRTEPTAVITERGFTGHHENRDIGLTYMNARFYVPYANRFLTPDTIVPDPTNPQSFNRYSYVYNNPLRFNDPSGHCAYVGDFAVDRDPNDSDCWEIVDYLVENYGVDINIIKYFDWSYGDSSGSIEGGGKDASYELVRVATVEILLNGNEVYRLYNDAEDRFPFRTNSVFVEYAGHGADLVNQFITHANAYEDARKDRQAAGAGFLFGSAALVGEGVGIIVGIPLNLVPGAGNAAWYGLVTATVATASATGYAAYQFDDNGRSMRRSATNLDTLYSSLTTDVSVSAIKFHER